MVVRKKQLAVESVIQLENTVSQIAGDSALVVDQPAYGRSCEYSLPQPPPSGDRTACGPSPRGRAPRLQQSLDWANVMGIATAIATATAKRASWGPNCLQDETIRGVSSSLKTGRCLTIWR